MMRISYKSPVFDGTFMIPVESLSTYAKRDCALLNLMALGGIHAKNTPEVRKFRQTMMAAKRKIERNQWFSVKVTSS
jgi:hypothetical protein